MTRSFRGEGEVESPRGRGVRHTTEKNALARRREEGGEGGRGVSPYVHRGAPAVVPLLS